eukprot:PITA_33328
MAAAKEVYSSLDACKGPPILMGDDSPIEVTGKGKVELLYGSFEDVLHVPKLSVNLLSVYQITHSDTEKRVEFTPDAVNIYDLHSNAKIATDSDWAGDSIDHKSTSGYSLSLGSGPICWSSKKHAVIALSSAQAEYRGVVNITIQALWLQHFLTELGV